MLTGEIGTIIAIIICFITKELWEIYKKTRTKKICASEMDKSIQFDILINDELATLRDRYSFNRVSLYDFSNGTGSLTGMSFKNVSMRYERVDLITKPIIAQLQHIPCSNIATLMQELNTEGIVEVISDKDNGNAASMQQRMFGVKQSFYFRLGSNLVNGCICLSSTHNDDFKMTHEDRNDIQAACDRILSIKEQMPRQRY